MQLTASDVSVAGTLSLDDRRVEVSNSSDCQSSDIGSECEIEKPSAKKTTHALREIAGENHLLRCSGRAQKEYASSYLLRLSNRQRLQELLLALKTALARPSPQPLIIIAL